MADVRRDGPGYLRGFSGTPAQQVWYFGAFRAAVAKRIPPALAARLDALVAEFSALAAAPP